MTPTEGRAGLRERGKERRRDQILDSAKTMIRDTGVAGLTMGPLAESAEVSLATIYNLFGDRAGVLTALVSRVMDDLLQTLDAIDEDDPLEHSRQFIATSVDYLMSDSAFFRPLVVALAPGANPGLVGADVVAIRSIVVHARAIATAVERRQLRDDLSPELLGYQVFMGWTTTQTLWGLGVIDDGAFGPFALYHRAATLLAVAMPRTRETLLADIAGLEPRLLMSLQTLAQSWAQPRGAETA